MLGGQDDDDRHANPIAVLALVVLAPLARRCCRWRCRSREFEADRSGADLIGNGEPLAGALLKLEEAARAIPMAVQPAQASKYNVTPLTGRRVQYAHVFMTHPPTSERVVRLRARQALPG
jgi:heat shock protein HtpX